MRLWLANYMGAGGGTIPAGSDAFFEGPGDVADTGRAISPEQALWLAVVGRCWLDAFEASDAFLVQSERKAADPEIVRAGARRWLVIDHSGWKADREMVCIMAGVDPDTIRDATRRRLKATRTQAAHDLDRAFLALVACSETLDAAVLDEALAALAALETEAA